jgi:hypothetical protein
LQRNGIDDRGERYVSSVNCVSIFNGSVGQECRNAAWIGAQMVSRRAVELAAASLFTSLPTG